MAQILLTTVASVATRGLPAIAGQLIGAAAGFAGGLIDKALFGKKTRRQVEGPRLESLSVLSATEGDPILRVYGRARIAGEIIWATRLREDIVTTTESTSGGKGGGGSSSSSVQTTEYKYFANFAVGLCEGEASSLNRAWADGKEIDLSDYTYRFYKGTETQNPDSLITTKEGAGNAPAYRGLSYVVFEDMPLEKFGNRIPQLLFEVIKPVATSGLESKIGGVNLIPGSTEFGYDTTIVEQQYGDAVYGTLTIRPENNHLGRSISDFSASLDNLASAAPNLETVCLVVAWFGDDLRAGNCTIRPKVESDDKSTTPVIWAVAGLNRSTALVVSQVDGRPAYGGTPNDESVKRAIAAIKARGWRVMFYPFILMDIASGNSLPDPYSDNAATVGQPAYPWRGRITCSPAPGFVGSPDKTGSATSQVSAFFSGTWGYENFIEHYATLCAAAGGVDYFCIGSEMVSLTTVRDSVSNYPFVGHLKTLAASVSAILPSAKIGYAANWDEYHSHRPSDGSGDVFFHLDPLWADANIDFVGIDNYMPLSDWRDDPDALDAALYNSIYDLGHLKANIEGGEFFDWFYASAADRAAQARSPIVDGAHGEDWIFGNKNIRGWWESAHHNRPGGVRDGSPTAWTAEGKPIIFTEIGCPAVDKGSNQPNVFVDPKSSESEIPYFSTGARDDLIQRQFLTAHLDYWADNGNNPVSSVYGQTMIDTANTHIWAWDARPAPVFPYNVSVYSDGPNWELGHWISNRLGTAPVPALLKELAAPYGLSAYTDFERSYGVLDGYVLDRIMSFREAVSPLELLFFFDFHESGGLVLARSKLELGAATEIDASAIEDAGENTDPVRVTRSQVIDLPAVAKVRFINGSADYKSAAVEARRSTVGNVRVATADVAAIIGMGQAQQSVDRWLYSLWSEMESAEFGLLPETLKLESGDTIAVPFAGGLAEFRIQMIKEGPSRRIEALSFDRGVFSGSKGAERTTATPPDVQAAQPAVIFMDMPLLLDSDLAHAPYVASYASPWSGVAIHRSLSDGNYQFNTLVSGPAIIGSTRFDFYSGPVGRYDYGNSLYVELLSGTLASQDEIDVLAGANACAVENADGEWEIVQFLNATLEDTLQYRLATLLRGQKGTEYAMRDPVAAGARVVFFNLAVQQLNYETTDLNTNYFLRFGPANRPISDALYVTEQHAFTGRGLKPLAPVHIRGLREADNDVVISWIRRTRIDGEADWRDGVEDVPLGEDSESYSIDILDGATVVRTLMATSQSVTYTAAQQTTDFGSPPVSLSVVVYQISASVGRGEAGATTLSF